MIAFTSGEIFSSMIYAAAYGVIFSALTYALRFLKSFLVSLARLPAQALRFDKLFAPPSFKALLSHREAGGLFSFVTIILFALGFVTVSYLSLDGVIRLYMLIIAFASFYLSNIAFCEPLGKLLTFAVDFALRLICLALRLFVFPFLLIIRREKK